MNGFYKLNADGVPVKGTLMDWVTLLESGCEIARETVGPSMVSTVFLGLDHSFGGPVPILWQTMVFDGPMDQERDRCSGTREQAEAMHARMVKRVRAAMKEGVS